jgi:hypothetical protein
MVWFARLTTPMLSPNLVCDLLEVDFGLTGSGTQWKKDSLSLGMLGLGCCNGPKRDPINSAGTLTLIMSSSLLFMAAEATRL